MAWPSFAEQYRLIDAAALAGDLGQSALSLAAEIEELPEDRQIETFEEQSSVLVSDAFTVIEAATMELLPQIRERRVPPQIITELNQLSHGLTEEEAASKRGVPKSTIKSWRKEIKAYLGTNTRNDTVAEAINRRMIHIEVTNTDQTDLSWMEDTVLRLAATGWTTREIAAHFNLSDNTIDRHYEEIRRKLDAKNMPHAVRRGYETGIFKIGEVIETTTESVNEMVLLVNSVGNETARVVIQDSREIDLLKKMLKIGGGSITARQAIEAEGSNAKGKMPHVGRTMQTLAQKLETAVGEPVILKRRLREQGSRVHVYVLNRGIDINFGTRHGYLPKYQASEVINPPKSRKKRAAKSPSQKPPSVRTTPPPAEPMPRAETESISPDIIPAEKLPKLDEALLSKLTARNSSEILLNKDIKLAVNALARNMASDYRTKILLFLRYGYHPAAPQTINRSGQFINTRLLQEYVPSHRGLNVISASLICGLSPLALLREEVKFIDKHKEEFPQLARLTELVDAEIQILEQIENS